MLSRSLACLTLGALAALGCDHTDSTPTDTHPRALRILFVTKETPVVPAYTNDAGVFVPDAYYHHDDAHRVGDTAVPAYLEKRGHTVVSSNDMSLFTDESLAQFDVVFFFVTSGQRLLDEKQRGAFQKFIESGHGFVGVHTATVTETDSGFYTALTGAQFWGHAAGKSQISPAKLNAVDPQSPLGSFLPRPWERSDEWYYFIKNPAENPELHPVLLLDESSLPPDYPDVGRVGTHPLSWTHEYAGGRCFYTALGHTGESYTEELVLKSIALGVEWAGATAPARR